jgi:alkanesulfonate monooxygenase SsuD/methylene tetrahydromethanopterin reductase-like flavin-dependent oxidoreductase (luciferase family)
MTAPENVALEPAAGARPAGRWITTRRQRPMSLAVMLPLLRPSLPGGADNGEDFWALVAKAKLAIEIGFDMIWFPDHFTLANFALTAPEGGIWECWTTLAGLAAALPGVPMGPMVACTGFHNPASIAKMAETIDSISQGNFVLGVGCGWFKPEYEMFGLPFDHRVDRFEEALHIISSLTRTGKANLEGQYYQARNAVNLPRGPRWQEGGPPILLGAKGPRMLRLTARYADAWNSDWLARPEDILPMVAELDKACAEVGRDPQTLVRSSSSRFSFDAADQNPMLVHGTPEEMAAVLHEYANLGMRQHLVTIDPRTTENFERFAEVIEIFDQG